jgi:hypothetical protein
MIIGRWRRQWRDDEVEILTESWNCGQSLSGIAIALGRSRSSVSNKVCRLDMTLDARRFAERCARFFRRQILVSLRFAQLGEEVARKNSPLMFLPFNN